jgi:hypothetical protein
MSRGQRYISRTKKVANETGSAQRHKFVTTISLRGARSLHELEVATRVNKSGLYSEFKDKEDLFLQSLQYYLEKKGLLTAEPLGWNNIERFLKMGPCSMEGQKGCFVLG